MDAIHRKVLMNKTKEIVEKLSNPRGMADVDLKHLFSDSDRQQIDREFDRNGRDRATQVLVSSLERRGKNAFSDFVTALRSIRHKHEDLADELEEEAERLGGHVERVAQTRSPQPYPNQCVPRGVTRHPSTNRPENITTHRQEPFGINTLLKDIPANVHQTIVSQLNLDDSLGKNWLAIAGCMKLSVGETNTLKQGNKMEGLFDKMIHQHMRVKDLVGFLAHKDVERRDVIDELKKANLVNDSDLGQPSEIDSSEVVTASHSTLEEAEPTRELLSPLRQNCQKLDDTARRPVQQESTEQKSVKDSVNKASPPGGAGATPLPKSQEETNPKSPNESETHRPVAQESMEETNDGGSDSVTDGLTTLRDGHDAQDGVKNALIIGCLEYEKLPDLKSFTKKIKELYHTLGLANWEVRKETRLTHSVQLKNKIQMFVRENRSTVCLLYLVGHTVQINGVNYLLPTDADPEMTRADLAEVSEDINQLLNSLSSTQLSVVFLDGAHECTEFQCRSALKGLASASPPPNILLACPTEPGVAREANKQLYYIDSLINQLSVKDRDLEDTFTQIRQKMRDLPSCPVEYSFLSSGLPFCLNPSDEGLGLQSPDENTPRHAIIVTSSRAARNTDHLTAALRTGPWNLETPDDLRDPKRVLRDAIRHLHAPPMRVVMVYFIGRAHQDNGENFLEFEAGVNLRLQWIVDLLCELIKGPKVVVVDNPEPSEDLAPMTAPQECLLSLPCARASNGPSEYTLRLSQLIGAHPQASIGSVLAKAANDEHVIYKNLFLA